MKKFVMKAFGAIFLALALVLTQVPVTDVFANTDGSDVFEMNGTTLVKYTGTAKTVSVSDTVKVIGEEAFAGNEFVTEIKLPSGLEEISYRAFADCSSLEKITISDNIYSVGSGAFSNCKALKEFYIGESLKDLGYGVFAGCDSLSKLNLSEKNTHFMYKDGLLYDDDGKILYCVLKGANLKKVSLPPAVEKIMPYAFWGCDSITSVGLSEYIDELDDYSLSNLKNLKSIVIPYSVERIGLKAFADCVNLKDVTIHPTVKNIHETAFDGCLKLNIIAEPGSEAYKFFENLSFQPIWEEEYEDVEDIIYNIHDNVESIEDVVTGKVEGPNTSEENLLGATVVSSGHAVILIDNTKQTVNVGASYNNKEDKDESITESIDNTSDVIDLFSTTDVKGNTIPKYTIIDNEIASKAYYGSKNMSDYKMPENITAINDFAFARSNLSSLTIPGSVTSIGYAAFYHCDNLENVVIPESVTQIEPFAFDNTKWLENWKNSGQSFLIVGDGILLAYNGGDSHVAIPEGVKKIAPYAFYKHSGLLSVSMPDSLIEIGEAAFDGCSNLEEVFGGTNVKVIKDRAFNGCPLKTVKITDAVESIGLLAFDLSDDRDAKEKTAIFYGTSIPVLTYEDSSTRLSNDTYRDYALKDVLFAVVDKGVTTFENSVLDDENSGFKGLILTVVSEENATLEIVKSYLSNEEINTLGITNKVSVFQKTYTISNFDDFMAENEPETKVDLNAGKQDVAVVNQSDVLPPSYVYDATSDVLNTWYTLIIEDLADATQISSFKNQYKKLYGEEMPANTCYLDLQLFEENCSVPITKLSKQGMLITVPLTKELQNGTLHIVCLDSDGQLEEVPYTISEIGGEKVAQIQVEHFSPYAMYSYKSNQFVAEAVVKDGEAVFTLGSTKLDESPDTGDYIHPKWVLVAGFGAIGIVLLLWRKKKI